MRIAWRRAGYCVVAVAGMSVATVTALARPGGDPPRVIPPADAPPGAVVVPVAYTEPAPRPDAAVTLAWAGPPAVRVGAANPYTLTVTNTAAQPAQKVVVQVRAPRGTALGDTAPPAAVVDGVHVWEVGTLAAGEAKPLGLTLTPAARGETGCQAWVTVTGTASMAVQARAPKLEVVVTAPEVVEAGEEYAVRYTVANVGDAEAYRVSAFVDDTVGGAPRQPAVRLTGGHDNIPYTLAPGQSRDGETRVTAVAGKSVTVTAITGDGERATAAAVTRVVRPVLKATVTGPATQLVGRAGTYRVRVENTGGGVARGLAVAGSVPVGWRVSREAPAAADLPPGQAREFTFDAVPSSVGVAEFAVTATARNATAQASCRTAVDGVAALRVGLVDTADPVAKGGETVYEVRVTNTGTKADTNVVVACPLPAELRLVKVDGPVGHTATALNACTVVRFDPVRELAPKTEAVFRLTVKTAAAGDVRFVTRVTSDQLGSSVTKEESTRVYGD